MSATIRKTFNFIMTIVKDPEKFSDNYTHI